MLNCSSDLSLYLTVNTFCLDYKSCVFAKSRYLTESTQPHTLGCHGSQGVRTHSSVTMVAMESRVWFAHVEHCFGHRTAELREAGDNCMLRRFVNVL